MQVGRAGRGEQVVGLIGGWSATCASEGGLSVVVYFSMRRTDSQLRGEWNECNLRRVYMYVSIALNSIVKLSKILVDSSSAIVGWQI